MRGRKRAAEEGDSAREGGRNAREGAISARVARARDDGDGRDGEDAVEEDVVKRLRTMAPDMRDSVLSKLFSIYGAGASGSGTPERGGTAEAEGTPPSRVLEVAVPKEKEEPKRWDWKTQATEWQLKSLTSALGMSSSGTREELVATVQKQLAELAEPAEQLSVSLEKMAKILSHNERHSYLKLAKGDSVKRTVEALSRLRERAKLQSTRVLEVDPFEAMRNREQGPCVLDLAYLYMDFVADAFDAMFPLLRAEATGFLTPGSNVTQQLNRCMFLIFKVIGTSTNEGNLYDPRRAGRFLIELGNLRSAWRMHCGNIEKLNAHFYELVDALDDGAELNKVGDAAGTSMDGEDAPMSEFKDVIQLTPYALTELHESYHGPPSCAPHKDRDETFIGTPKSWATVWQAGSSSPEVDTNADASANVGAEISRQRTHERMFSTGSPPPENIDDAVPRGGSNDSLDQHREYAHGGDLNAEGRHQHALISNSRNFAQRAFRFEVNPQTNVEHMASRGTQHVDLNELHNITQGGNLDDYDDRSFIDWVTQGNNADNSAMVNRLAGMDAALVGDASEARLHASRLANSTRVQARLAFTERGHTVRVSSTPAMSSSRMRDATSITRLVTNLSTRLRSVSTPLLDTGRSKTTSPNTIKLFEHIARWELLGYSYSSELEMIGVGRPTLLAERLGALSSKDGRWCAVLGRALTVHCMPMQICIMNGLVSESHGEFKGSAAASMFCTAVTVVIRMILKSYHENGGTPKLRESNWWKTLAHLSDILITWSCGGTNISSTFPNTNEAEKPEMSNVAAKAILIGLKMPGGDAQYSYGKLFAIVAPKLLHDVAAADVPSAVVDAISGVCYLFGRIMCHEAKTEPLWTGAVDLCSTTIPAQLRASLDEACEWARHVRDTSKHAESACTAYVVESRLLMTDEPDAPAVMFRGRANVRRGVRLGLILGLAAAISRVSGKRIKAVSDLVIPPDEDEELQENEKDVKGESGIVKRSSGRTNSKRALHDVIDLNPVIGALDDCVNALACIGVPLAMLGWALDGGEKGIRGGLQLLGNSRWLHETAGEFPVHSPAQQIVDMTQLFLHTFAELRPSGTSSKSAVNALLSQRKWFKTFSLLHAVSPNMFYFGSSLDLIGASTDAFPHSFKIARLRKDLRRHAAEFQNTTSLSVTITRDSPCGNVWLAVESTCRRALVGRSLTVTFEGEDGLGDGVNREAMQVLIDSLARGPAGKPEEAVLCSLPASDASMKPCVFTFRPDVPLAAARFFGRVIGLIVASGVNINLPLAPWIWSALLGRKGAVSQLAAADENFARTLMTLCTHPITHDSNKWIEATGGLTFVRTIVVGNDVVNIDLVPNGSTIRVTEANRKQFVRAYARNSMHVVDGKSCEAAMYAAREGLCDIIPPEILASLSPVDLERVVCGLPKIAVAAWKSATIYEPKITSAEEQRRVDWFWEAIESFTPSDQALVLHFWAAYTHLPHSGFEGLNFKVRFDEKLSTDHLPMAQTCFLTLRIPKYTSAEQCATRLLHAVRTGCTGFGFA